MPDSVADIAICAPRIFDGHRFLADRCVLLQGDTVQAVLPQSDIPPSVDRQILDEGTLAPGLVDLQVNGGGDLLFNAAPQQDTVAKIAAAHRSIGTTALLPTVISDTPEVQQSAVQAVAAAIGSGHPGILGIHLEGPFLKPGRRGAHRRDRLRALTDSDVQWLCGLTDFPVLLTLAPEQVPDKQLQRLAASGLQLCAGHTEASYEELLNASANGLSGVTHLYNAMSPLQSRAPGAVGAALDIDALWAGIIADGHHVHPAAIRLAWRSKPAGKLVLVSDAMATVGGTQSRFEIYGESISEQNGRLVNAEGRLAGSAIGLIDAVSYAHRSVGLPLDECLRMASLYPATIMGLDGKLGQLAPGARADLFHFDDNFRVHHTWVAGDGMRHNN